jgi:hypothetical protein
LLKRSPWLPASRNNAWFRFSLIASCFVWPFFSHAQAVPPAKISGSPPKRITKFYDTPKPLPAGKPGELIHSSPADDYFLNADFSAFRILYHSRSATGQDVAVSGVVLVPDGTPPKGGWPVIAWAHGFTGGGRQCAPSLLRNLYYGPFFAMYVKLGYAVVATDYAGLGTDFRNAVTDVPSNATDVIDSIPAARAAVPQLGLRWVAMGPYLGADVTIGVAEMEGQIRDPNYLGSVAISGVADWNDVYERVSKEEFLPTLAFLAYGTKTVYPDFNVHDMLTGKALVAYQHINESCASVGKGPPFPSGEVLKHNWQNSRFVKGFLDRNTLGRNSAFAPLLVIADERDQTIAPWMTARVVTRMCKQGDRVQFTKFSDIEPGRVIGGSVRDQMSWIEARFAGRSITSNCP